MAKRDYKKGAIQYEFYPLPKAVINSEEYIRLPPAAKVLLVDLMAQYTGGNNGRLWPGFEALQRRGWSSKATLNAAKKALLQCSFVVLTRKGHPPKTAEWIGFTWWELNYERTMDIDPRSFPHLNFMNIKKASIDPNNGRESTIRKINPVVQKLYRSPAREQYASTETVPIDSNEAALSVQNLYHCS